MSMDYRRIPEELLERRVQYTRWISAWLNKVSRQHEYAFNASDIYDRAIIKIAQGKRHFNKHQRISTQFKNILKSIAYNMVRRQIRRNKYMEKYKKEEAPLAALPDVVDEKLLNAVDKLREWIIKENKVELFFVTNELMKGSSQDEIAAMYHISIRRIRHLRRVLYQKLKTLL